MPRSHATSLVYLANHIRQAIFIYEVEAKQFTFLNPAFEEAFNMTKGTAIEAGSLLKRFTCKTGSTCWKRNRGH